MKKRIWIPDFIYKPLPLVAVVVGVGTVAEVGGFALVLGVVLICYGVSVQALRMMSP